MIGGWRYDIVENDFRMSTEWVQLLYSVVIGWVSVSELLIDSICIGSVNIKLQKFQKFQISGCYPARCYSNRNFKIFKRKYRWVARLFSGCVSDEWSIICRFLLTRLCVVGTERDCREFLEEA